MKPADSVLLFCKEATKKVHHKERKTYLGATCSCRIKDLVTAAVALPCKSAINYRQTISASMEVFARVLLWWGGDQGCWTAHCVGCGVEEPSCCCMLASPVSAVKQHELVSTA